MNNQSGCLNVNGLIGHLEGRGQASIVLQSSGIHILALNGIKLDPQCPKELTAMPE